jgi:hypothetical protein
MRIHVKISEIHVSERTLSNAIYRTTVSRSRWGSVKLTYVNQTVALKKLASAQSPTKLPKASTKR